LKGVVEGFIKHASATMSGGHWSRKGDKRRRAVKSGADELLEEEGDEEDDDEEEILTERRKSPALSVFVSLEPDLLLQT